MRKLLLLIFILSFLNSGCKKTLLKKNDPVTLNMWHVYGEQSYSPMNEIINEFNETIGYEKGIIINVTALSNANEIGAELLAAQKNYPSTPDMPDLFFAHASNARALGVENLINWNELFSESELQRYVPEFLKDGIIDDKLIVLPTSKSTLVLYIAGNQFDDFSNDTGIIYSDLTTWDGFFDAAKKYYDWSHGKSFCNFDYIIRNVELYAQAEQKNNFISETNDSYVNNKYFKNAFNVFGDAIINGYIKIADMYSNTQIMTGEVMCGIGSTAAILYFNDNITHDDGTVEPIELKILPLPQLEEKNFVMPIAGVGLCAYKTTPQKAEAAKVFLTWFTSLERNFNFVCETGYMPVTKGSFEKIKNHRFKNEKYEALYKTIQQMYENASIIKNSSDTKYYDTIDYFHNYLRQYQDIIHQRKVDGEDIKKLSIELWNSFCN